MLKYVEQRYEYIGQANGRRAIPVSFPMVKGVIDITVTFDDRGNVAAARSGPHVRDRAERYEEHRECAHGKRYSRWLPTDNRQSANMAITVSLILSDYKKYARESLALRCNAGLPNHLQTSTIAKAKIVTLMLVRFSHMFGDPRHQSLMEQFFFIVTIFHTLVSIAIDAETIITMIDSSILAVHSFLFSISRI